MVWGSYLGPWGPHLGSWEHTLAHGAGWGPHVGPSDPYLGPWTRSWVRGTRSWVRGTRRWVRGTRSWTRGDRIPVDHGPGATGLNPTLPFTHWMDVFSMKKQTKYMKKHGICKKYAKT